MTVALTVWASGVPILRGAGVAYGARTRNLRSHNPMLCH